MEWPWHLKSRAVVRIAALETSPLVAPCPIFREIYCICQRYGEPFCFGCREPRRELSLPLGQCRMGQRLMHRLRAMGKGWPPGDPTAVSGRALDLSRAKDEGLSWCQPRSHGLGKLEIFQFILADQYEHFLPEFTSSSQMVTAQAWAGR